MRQEQSHIKTNQVVHTDYSSGRADGAARGGRRADVHRPADQGSVVALLHRGVKGVHVEMADDAEHYGKKYYHGDVKAGSLAFLNHFFPVLRVTFD